MKNNIKTLCLSSLIIIETIILLFICFSKFSNNIKVIKVNDNSYELNFSKKKDISMFVMISDKGFDSISFRDKSNNQGAITFEEEYGGYYFSIYNASLNYAIDNRLSQEDGFKFQRLERFGEKLYCYDIRYDDDIIIKNMPLPVFDSSDTSHQ
ncbi:MAG: hypothetical protein IK002_10365 [Treponema sp.]|uniref:hypothetical protein n=1 Tax=Treponema sp. TaxID=166 RepID=UPI00298DDE61|nr:hypothetical protein [Treponema sp.]MBR5934378.1 hypothetical protein [Treponema sp.]